MAGDERQTKMNYWSKLAKLGHVYGRDIIRTEEIISGNHGPRFTVAFEFRGKLYRTAKDIFETL